MQRIEKIRSQASKKPKGLIYLATSPSGKQYVGQHNSMHMWERKRSHNYRYTEFLKKKCILELNKLFNPTKQYPNNPTGYCTALYCAFQKYGFYSFTWEVLKKGIPLSELDSVEDVFIEDYNTLAPHGYNLMTNGTCDLPKFSEETRKKNV